MDSIRGESQGHIEPIVDRQIRPVLFCDLEQLATVRGQSSRLARLQGHHAQQEVQQAGHVPQGDRPVLWQKQSRARPQTLNKW